MKKVVIIGGGITGLAAAYYLKDQEDVEVTLIEASDRLGGKVVTTKDNGYLVEGGPDSFITTKPQAIELAKELGLEHEIINPELSKFYVLHKGHLVQSPEGFNFMVPTKFMPFLKSNLFSLAGKMRLMAEPLIPAKKNGKDETLGDFVRRRMGSEILEKFAEPLLSGIYNTDADQLSLNASFPMFKQMEAKYGSITKAILERKKENGSQTSGRSAFVSLKGGIESLIKALANELGNAEIKLNTKVERIEKIALKKYKVFVNETDLIEADDILLTIPAWQSAGLLEKFCPEAVETLREIPYSSTYVVTLAYKRDAIQHPLNASGFVIPKKEAVNISSCTWSSSKWKDRSPEGHFLIRCYFKNHPENITDGQLAETAHQDLEKILNITSKPEKYWMNRWEKVLPNYTLGHLERVQQIEKKLKESCPGIYVAGSAYRGVGIPDCIKQAREVVEKVM